MQIQNENETYKFDLDKNGFPALTEKNVKLINFLIENDSNYRSDDDPQNTKSTYNVIRKYGKTYDVKELEEIITLIDKQNSTHQASEGPQGGNKGRKITAEHISNITDFYERLEDGKPELVNEIAKAIPTRYTFSFASKFCTYMSRYLFKADYYSIYDFVLCKIIPYYAWIYLGEKYTGTKKSNVDKKFGEKDKGDYKGYRDLIDRIRKKSEDLTNYEITRCDFDHLLWYYFKGDRDIKDGKKVVYESRITKALALVGKEEARL